MLRKQKPIRFAIICGIVTLLGGWLRIFFISEPLWIDELHTGWVVAGETSSVFHRCAIGNQTPIYFFLVHFIGLLTGISELSLRIPSLICGMASIFLAGRFVFSFSNQIVPAIIASILVAIDSWFLFWSVEARPYACLQLIAIVQTWLLGHELGMPADSRRTSVRLILLTAALPLCHLSAAALILVQSIFVLFFASKQARNRIFVSFGISTILGLLATPVLLQVLNNKNDWSETSNSATLAYQTSPLLASSVIAIVSWSLHRFKRNETEHLNDTTVLPLVSTCVIGTVGLAVLLSSTGLLPIASPRYLAAALALSPVFIGLALSNASQNLKFIGPIVLTCAVSLNPIALALLKQQSVSYRHEDWKSAIGRLNETADENQPLVFLFANLYEDRHITKNSAEKFQEYLSFPLNSIYPIRQNAQVTPMPSLTESCWQETHLKAILEHGQAQIIARVPDYDFQQRIIRELAHLAKQNQIDLEIRLEHEPQNLLKLANIEVKQKARGSGTNQADDADR